METMCQYLLSLALFGILMGTSQAAIEEHRIDAIPNISINADLIQYSGHLPLTNGSSFYWFIESEKREGNIPLVLWLNGGPGCSSIGSGLFTENGPFLMDLVSEEAKIIKNPYSWHKIAHMLYLDAPLGTGYSFSTTEGNITDVETAISDMYQALTYFFSKYSEYCQNDFYIFGQSLAGVYIPPLVDKIVSTRAECIKIKGFAVGGGFLNYFLRSFAQVEFASSTFMLGSNYLKEVIHMCCSEGQTRKECAILLAKDYATKSLPHACVHALEYIMWGTNYHAVNKYNTIKECIHDPESSGSYSVCVLYSRVEEFLNRTDVQNALHVERSKETPPYILCRKSLGGKTSERHPGYTTNQGDYDTSKYFRQFIEEQELDILVYSGDVDLKNPARAGELFTYLVNEKEDPLKIPSGVLRDEWFDRVREFEGETFYTAVNTSIHKLLEDENANIPWFYQDNLGYQRGGYSITYPQNKYTFITVRGAGAAVPSDKPLAALTLFCKFIRGEGFGMNTAGSCLNIDNEIISGNTNSVSSCIVQNYAHILTVSLFIVLYGCLA